MRAGRSIVEYPLLLLWPGDLGDLGGEGNSGFRNYSNIMRQGNVMVWWKYLNSCTSNRVSSYSSFNIWSAERLKDGNDASSATYMHFQSCRPVGWKCKDFAKPIKSCSIQLHVGVGAQFVSRHLPPALSLTPPNKVLTNDGNWTIGIRSEAAASTATGLCIEFEVDARVWQLYRCRDIYYLKQPSKILNKTKT